MHIKDKRLFTAPELIISIQEIDERIIPHAMRAVQQGDASVIVLSSATDIFILLITYVILQ